MSLLDQTIDILKKFNSREGLPNWGSIKILYKNGLVTFISKEETHNIDIILKQ